MQSLPLPGFTDTTNRACCAVRTLLQNTVRVTGASTACDCEFCLPWLVLLPQLNHLLLEGLSWLQLVV